nr:hypothetical protein [uncultured Rhodopila sp.]
MPDPSALLAVARLLLSAEPESPASDARLRRAVSTAYYALFHKVLRSGAECFMGAGKQQTAGYGLLYRSFNHGRMKSVCGSLSVQTLGKTLRQQLGRTAVSQDMRDFAGAFVTLQDARHVADYDLAADFNLLASTGLVETAGFAIAAFDRTLPEEKADVLALMLANSRG